MPPAVLLVAALTVPRRIAFVYGAPLGTGGLGVQAGNALRALALGATDVHAIGPGVAPGWPVPASVAWHVPPRPVAPRLRWTPLRRFAGVGQHVTDLRTGRFAARVVDRIHPDLCYAFTQVGLETLRWGVRHGVPSVIESPNGHIAAFRSVYEIEAARWCSGRYLGHPTRGMVARVQEEYAIASAIRVSSEWARNSLVAGGVTPARVHVLQQPVDLDRFSALPHDGVDAGPLRVCFVGSLDLRKGFVYLLRAARALGDDVFVEFVGATGDRCSRLLLERERVGVNVAVAPGDPRPSLARCDVFAQPTLEDGSPFAVAEAMASGRAVITTASTGAAEWVRESETGWVVAPASDDALARALREARQRRGELAAMGRRGRLDTEARVAGADLALAAWASRL